MMANDGQQDVILPRQFVRVCRRNLQRPKVADSSGVELTGGSLLMRTLILRRLLRREVFGGDEQHVGLLLPPSVPAAVANAAVSIDRRIAVNLNYTVSSEIMNDCIAQCRIRHVLTSRRVMEKLDLNLEAELVFLEELREKVTLTDKLAAAVQTWLWPAWLLERRLGLNRIDPEDVLTVIFTSGSTGRPKGVMLTHRNVGTNVAGFNTAICIKPTDVTMGILPMFHSFGYTANLWMALALEPKVVFHYSPREARPIGKLCQKHGATIMIATPTFLRWYVRGCQPEDFAKLEAVLTGAEKLPVDVADRFEQKFGIRPVEGYGTTELSPVVGINVPPSRTPNNDRPGCKEGTIGRPIRDVLAKVVDSETGEDLGTNQPGILLIKGPNVMKGYLGRPDLTAEVIRDGWYNTGDVAAIDDEGFIQITGRESRFSKIGGEMVPHIRIEEDVAALLGLDDEDPQVVVTAVPDAKKGERLIVLHTALSQTPESICRGLSEQGLPPIWIPAPDSFCQVDEIPVLGTGKLDLKRMKEVALERFSK